MSDQMTKAELLSALRDARARWERLLEEIGEVRMTAPGANAEWSIKDIVAHITAWEERPVEWLQAAMKGETPRAAGWPTDLTEEQLNAWIFQANRERPLHEVLRESREVSRQLVDAVEAISEEDLLTPKRFGWLSSNTLIEEIPGNSFDHYRDHEEMLRSWITSANA